MNPIQSELKFIKSAYNDIMSIQQRKRYQKCASISKDFIKLQSELGIINSKDNQIFKSVKKEVDNLKRAIENTYKNQTSDYQAFLWKSQKLNEKSFPDCFRLIKIDPEEGKQYNQTKMKKIDFPVLSYKLPKLIEMATFILQSNQFLKNNVSEDVLFNLVKSISLEYNILSYHNFSHAFSLQLQLYQSILRVSVLQKQFSSYQIGFAYIAALAHDLTHNGTNTSYQIQKKTDLAITYNFESVLQNMHVSQFLKILRDNPKLDVFSSLKNAVQRQKAKRLITKLILATDITKHFPNLVIFSQKVQAKIVNKESQLALDFKNFQDRQIALQQLFHACDIGNPCVGFQNYMNWSTLLSYQFNKQTQLQMKQGIQVSQMLKYKGLKSFYSGQIGFVKNLVLPQWKQLIILWPQLKQFYKNLQQNIKQLTQRAEKE